jgi:hypothetical protein
MRKKPLLAALGAASAATLLAATAPASAAPTMPVPKLWSSQLAAPFNIAFRGAGAYVADGGLNEVVRVRSNGSLQTVVAGATGTSGIAFSANGRHMGFTTTTGGEGGITASGLNIWGPRGSRVLADTLAYEKAHNPDQNVTYGVRGVASQSCRDGLAQATGLPATYKGQVDSHAYSVASYGGKWLVADAGGNDLLRVTNSGRISTLAVFPSQPLTVTAAMANALGLPMCAGVTYRFEAVPTDVEVGRDGYLYVTTLAGGPEGPAGAVLGARSKLYRVNPRTGHLSVVATGLNGATNLAIGKHGRIYVAELFGNQISVIKGGKPHKYLGLDGVVAVETDHSGALWASTLDESGQQPGKLFRITKVRNNS